MGGGIGKKMNLYLKIVLCFGGEEYGKNISGNCLDEVDYGNVFSKNQYPKKPAHGNMCKEFMGGSRPPVLIFI